MKKDIQINYNRHYEEALTTKEDLEKIKASDFLNYFSDLIIKYSSQIEKKISSKSEDTYNGV